MDSLRTQISKAFPTADLEAVIDLHLVLANDGDFYRRWLLPLYQHGEAYFKEGQFHREGWENALVERIRLHARDDVFKWSSYHHSYYGVIPKVCREAIARIFCDELLSELERGNSYLPKEA